MDKKPQTAVRQFRRRLLHLPEADQRPAASAVLRQGIALQRQPVTRYRLNRTGIFAKFPDIQLLCKLRRIGEQGQRIAIGQRDESVIITEKRLSGLISRPGELHINAALCGDDRQIRRTRIGDDRCPAPQQAAHQQRFEIGEHPRIRRRLYFLNGRRQPQSIPQRNPIQHPRAGCLPDLISRRVQMRHRHQRDQQYSRDAHARSSGHPPSLYTSGTGVCWIFL